MSYQHVGQFVGQNLILGMTHPKKTIIFSTSFFLEMGLPPKHDFSQFVVRKLILSRPKKKENSLFTSFIFWKWDAPNIYLHAPV